MKERPILFSGQMVMAILEGRKTMTRRVVKPHPTHQDDVSGEFRVALPGGSIAHLRCPYGKPGDRLWVREAWRVAECYDNHSGAELAGILSARNVQYDLAEQFLGQVAGRYRHARFMPRWASRITLKITAVRVERLNDITVADAVAEGALVQREVDQFARVHAISMFSALWQGIHGPGSWAANPWVWVVEFRKLAPEGGA